MQELDELTKNQVDTTEPLNEVEAISKAGNYISKFLQHSAASDSSLIHSTYEINSNLPQQIIAIDCLPFCCLCEHHAVPFFGEISIRYIPYRLILGLGRFGKYIDQTAQTLSLQEKLGSKLTQDFFDVLKPKAFYMKIIGWHGCLAMDKHKKGQFKLTTNHFLGDFNLRSHLAQ